MAERGRTSPSTRPRRITQVNEYLRQNAVKGIELRRGNFYFEFVGPSIAGWLNRIVQVKAINALTLREWIAKYRELEKQNRSLNALLRKPAKPRK